MEIADYIVADDRTLAERVIGGDAVAFEFLFNRYKEAIRRLFVQRLGLSLIHIWIIPCRFGLRVHPMYRYLRGSRV